MRGKEGVEEVTREELRVEMHVESRSSRHLGSIPEASSFATALVASYTN